MSIHNRAVAAVISQLALAADGFIFGAGLAYIAVRTLLKFRATSSAIRKIHDAPALRVTDLRSVVSPMDDSDASEKLGGGSFVIVRGVVEAKSAVDGYWKTSKPPNVLVSHETGDHGVVLKRTQTCIYNEWRGFFGWTSDLCSFLLRSGKEQESTSIRMVPFVLVEGGKWTVPDYVTVDMDGSRHDIPLTTVYHQLQPVKASPYTLLQALFGQDYPVALLGEEKMLPLGYDITAVGICSMRNGRLEIKSCQDIPYFLSDLTKDQMLVELAFRQQVLFWSGIALGVLSTGILGYSLVRNWKRWKAWRRSRRLEHNRAADDANAEEETGDVPDGELCVVCLMRRRRSAFIPCGHRVCCQRCAVSVEHELAPKCPICRQTISGSVSIFDS